MFRFSKYGNLVALIFCLVSLSNNVLALNCYEKSPNWIKSGDEYFNLDATITLSDDGREMLKSFYSKIEGNWEGDLKETECFGPDRNPVKKYKNYELTANIIPSASGGLTIKTTRYQVKEKISKGTTISLLDGAHIFEFKLADNSHLIYSDRYRRNIIGGGSRFNEYVNDLEVNGNTLIVKLSFFVNGVYVADETWTLTRK